MQLEYTWLQILQVCHKATCYLPVSGEGEQLGVYAILRQHVTDVSRTRQTRVAHHFTPRGTGRSVVTTFGTDQDSFASFSESVQDGVSLRDET